MINKLLCDDTSLVFSPQIAQALKQASPRIDPVSAATVLQQIHYWLTKECGKVIDNVRWIYNTYGQWLEQFPWLSEWKLRKIFYQLRELKVIKFEQHDKKKYNRKGYYTIDYKCLEALHKSRVEGEESSFPSHSSKCEGAEDRSAGEQTIDVCNAHTLDETETSTEISTEATNNIAVEEKEVEKQPHEESRGRNSNVVDDSCSPPVCSGVADRVLHPLDEVITEDSSTPGITDEASPSAEEIKDVEIELRRLSPDININPQVKSAIRSFWHNVPAGLARVKTAIAQGWCKQPTGLFVQTLKNGASRDEEAVVVTKEYPRPTLEQLNQLGELGELVYTKFNEPGYPEVLTIKILGKNELLPWWVVLGICLEPE